MDQITLEAELEPKSLDTGVRAGALKFQFQLHNPALGYCRLRYKKCIC